MARRRVFLRPRFSLPDLLVRSKDRLARLIQVWLESEFVLGPLPVVAFRLALVAENAVAVAVAFVVVVVAVAAAVVVAVAAAFAVAVVIWFC